MTCQLPERIPLTCPDCHMHIGYYIQIGNATYVMLGFELTQSVTGQCFCGFRFINMAMPKSWEKLKRRYFEKVNDETTAS